MARVPHSDHQAQLRVLPQVGRRSGRNLGAVPQVANREITPNTQQTANLTVRVAVVYRQPCPTWQRPTDGAFSSLRFENTFVLIERNSELSAESPTPYESVLLGISVHGSLIGTACGSALFRISIIPVLLPMLLWIAMVALSGRCQSAGRCLVFAVFLLATLKVLAAEIAIPFSLQPLHVRERSVLLSVFRNTLTAAGVESILTAPEFVELRGRLDSLATTAQFLGYNRLGQDAFSLHENWFWRGSIKAATP